MSRFISPSMKILLFVKLLIFSREVFNESKKLSKLPDRGPSTSTIMIGMRYYNLMEIQRYSTSGLLMLLCFKVKTQRYVVSVTIVKREYQAL